MSDLARVVVILERLSPAELDQLDSHYRERLEEVLHRWWTLASRRRHQPRYGVLSHLSDGERAP